MSRLRLGVGTVAAVAVLLAGCASDSNKAVTGPADTTANAPGVTVSAADGGSAATATPETTPNSGDAFPGLSGTCKEKYASYLAKVAQLGSKPDTYKDLVPLLTELLAGAPADVQAAAQPSLDAFGKFAALIEKYNGDIAKASKDPDFVAVETALSSADSKAAGKKIEDWLKSTCGG